MALRLPVAWISCVLIVSCFGAVAAACGGGGSDAGSSTESGTGTGGTSSGGSKSSAGHGGASAGKGGTSQGGSSAGGHAGTSGGGASGHNGGTSGAGGSAGKSAGGSAGSSSSTGGSGGATGGHAGGAGKGGASGSSSSAGGSSAGDSGSGGSQVSQQVLLVKPIINALTITSEATPATQQFTAYLSTDPGTPVTANWTLDSYAIGDIDQTGLFTTTVVSSGSINVTATYGSLSTTVFMSVAVDISEDDPSGMIDPGNHTALGNPPIADPGPDTTKFLYPYDKTVMPRALTTPLLQFSQGSVSPEDALITISASQFSWKGYFHVAAPATPQYSPPQSVWDGAMLAGGTVTINVVKAAGGIAYGPAQTTVIPAATALKGAVYYMTYQTPGNGLWSVRPGVSQPATQLVSGCIVCHSVSANGVHLAVGTDDATLTAQAGVYSVSSDGTASQVTASPDGLGGDSRAISMAAFTPDGVYLTRSQSNFWGGPNTLAWRVDDTNKVLVPATVVGLGADVSSLIPSFSPDGTKYGFTTGDADTVPVGTPHRSLNIMDVSIDAPSDTLTFSNRTVITDNGPGGSVTKFLSFLPNSNLVVFEEGENFNTGYDEMLPTWGPDSSFDTSTGRLSYLDTTTKQKVVMATLNQGNAAIDANRNYEPFALPVTAGGYFWIVFTSIREYGNVYQGAAAQKQLWVAAIDTNAPPGTDPSHPPFYLPDQSNTKNERGFWALEPCKSDGGGCTTGDECCTGFCRPSDPTNPGSPKTCQNSVPGQCSEDSEKCTGNADCCGVASGSQCIGGFCTGKP